MRPQSNIASMSHDVQGIQVQALSGSADAKRAQGQLQQLLAVQKFGIGLSSQLQDSTLLCTGKSFPLRAGVCLMLHCLLQLCDA